MSDHIKDKGIFNALSSYNISFPKDYITFIILGGVVWPWLQEKTGWSDSMMYLLGSLTFLYIISSDGKYLLPKKNYEHQFDKTYWYSSFNYELARNDKSWNYPETTIKDKAYDEYGDYRTETYPLIIATTIYSAFFYSLLGSAIYFLFKGAPRIYPFIDD